MQGTVNAVVGRRYVSYIAAVKLAWQYQQFVDKNF